MLKAFPESVPAIVGEPTLKDIIRVLRHLIDCSQSHQVTNNNGLNLLHICLPPALYAFFVTDPANQQYPARAADPGAVPAHNPAGNPMVWSNKKLEWECRKMRKTEEDNMDQALVERFLQLVLEVYKADFKIALNQDPNITFGNAFQWFLERYADHNENNRDENRTKMKFEWTIADNFPI